MKRESAAMRDRLEAEGWWRQPSAPASHSVWYIRVLLGFSAWLAALLLLPMAGMLLADALGDSAAAILAAALVCCGLAIPLLRSTRGDFLPQLGGALSLAGLVLVVIEGAFSDGPGWLVIGAMAAIMYAVGPVLIHRFLTASVLALALVMGTNDLFDLVDWSVNGVEIALMAWLAALRWGAQLRWHDRRLQALDPLAWVFALAAVVATWEMPAVPIGGWGRSMVETEGFAAALLPTVSCALLPVAAWAWASLGTGANDRVSGMPRMGMALVLLALMPAWLAAPGISLGLAWLILGFALGRPALLGLGAVAMLVYLGGYYYQLDTTLLQKSLWLAVAGVTLGACVLGMTLWDRRAR